jgi:hypothetical protein
MPRHDNVEPHEHCGLATAGEDVEHESDRGERVEDRDPEGVELPRWQRTEQLGERVEATAGHHLRREPRSVLST